jgi:beta-phosphoglucomutase-like phosphatase (HAD superfamily)
LRRTTYDDLDGWEASAIQAVEAIPESIEALRDHLHLPTAVVTNNGFQAAVRGLERLEDEGVDTARIGGLVHRCAALRAKPSPAMFQVAIDRLAGVVGRASTSVVVVGDSPGDAAAARALAVELSIPVRFVGV